MESTKTPMRTAYTGAFWMEFDSTQRQGRPSTSQPASTVTKGHSAHNYQIWGEDLPEKPLSAHAQNPYLWRKVGMIRESDHQRVADLYYI